MPTIQKEVELQNIRNVGLGGISSLEDPQNIKDEELVDARNIVFDDGVISPRMGSEFKLAKPTGETGVPTQMMVASTSDGTDFLLGIWGPNYYLYDSTTPQWIKINGSVVPTIQGAGVFYGNTPWNNGKNDDRLYFCNGTDQFVKWQISIGYLSITTAAGDSVLTLTDATRFPTGGGYSIIIQNGATQIIKPVASATATTITLNATTVGAVVLAGSAITIQCVNVAAMNKGNILTKYSRRLFVSGGKNTESTVAYSKIDLPEDFGTTADVATGGIAVITQGSGGVTDLQGFGQYMLISKEDAQFSFSFQINSTLGAQIVQILPLVLGSAMGPFKPYLNVTAENHYYYPTVSEGIYKISPLSTGSSASVDAKSVSMRITNIIQDSNFTFLPGRVCVHERKIYWLCSNLATPTTVNNTLTNNLILVYDILWDAWTVFDSWSAVDIKNVNGDLYFIGKNDGDLYRAYQGYYQDFAGETNTIGYSTYALTKRFDFGLPAQVKTFKAPIYLQGYIDPSTTLYVDVLYNEMGGLGKQTYKVVGTNTNYVTLAPTVSLGSGSLGSGTTGGTLVATTTPNGNLFRVYLDTSHSYGFYNVQLKFYTDVLGSNWAVTFIGFDPNIEGKLPPELTVSPA